MPRTDFARSAGPPPPVHQADAVIAQGNPVSGTQYPVLATTGRVRIIGIAARVTWTDQPTPLEVWIEKDGETLRHYTDNPLSGGVNWYTAAKAAQSGPTFQTLGTTRWDRYYSFLWEGRSVKIDAEITGGTVSLLDCRVKWARWP